MSETIYAWLLRLFPSSFREAYGEDALQLYRDRAREEQGLFAGTRLWFDLLSDLALSLPRWHRHKHPLLAVPRVQTAAGIPSFQSFQRELPRFDSILYGMLAWLVVYGAILYLLDHGHRSFASERYRAHQTTEDPDDSTAPATDKAHAAGDPTAPMVGSLMKPRPMVSFSYKTTRHGSRPNITLKAAVYPLGAGPTPTGYVVFFDGDNAIDAGQLENGIVKVQDNLLCTKTDFLKAIYYGDGNYSYGGSLPPLIKGKAPLKSAAAPVEGHGCKVPSSTSSNHHTNPPQQVLFMAVGP